MNRFKFRVWCKNKNQWEKDSCFISRDGTLLEIRATGELRKYNEQNHIITQFTGLLDKNGIEIFEGDIIKIHDSIIAVVKYGGQGERFVEASFYASYGYMGQSLSVISSIEVLGNIFENSELLEKGEK